MQDPVMKEAKEALDRLSADPAAQELVHQREIALHFYQRDLQAAKEEGEAKGRSETLRKAVGRLCEVFGIELDDQKRQQLAAMSVLDLEALFDTLTRERRWPAR
jgi:hypothetical protein